MAQALTVVTVSPVNFAAAASVNMALAPDESLLGRLQAASDEDATDMALRLWSRERAAARQLRALQARERQGARELVVAQEEREVAMDYLRESRPHLVEGIESAQREALGREARSSQSQGASTRPPCLPRRPLLSRMLPMTRPARPPTEAVAASPAEWPERQPAAAASPAE